MRDGDTRFEDAMKALGDAVRAACAAAGPEEALREITGLGPRLLGDRDAHLRPGALKAGERQFTVCGAFIVTPDAKDNLLIAEHGFPPEQHRLRVDIALGHPGWVVKHRRPRLLANTDEHADFTQILKTSRMGSAMFAPMVWRGELVGQLVLASQARNTYDEHDLGVLITLAEVATALWQAHDGRAFLTRLRAP
jgi:hypothetical protein